MTLSSKKTINTNVDVMNGIAAYTGDPLSPAAGEMGAGKQTEGTQNQ